MTYWMKVHHNPEGKLVAACDTEVLGEVYTEGKMRLEVDAAFYQDKEVEFVQLLEEMEAATTTNFVGEHLITELVESDLVQEDEVEHVDGVPHVQMFFI
ncbi:MAG: DUF424 family protein [Candidatus Nanohaloarchaea archaeon]|nr:DUF424 family protein [Candidatus Nanohaloarchaea archaeon]